jgi:thioredoxin-like negative regulator of GroEL
VHGLREQYQDRINFVILDWDIREENDLADDLGVRHHPAFGFVSPDGEVLRRMFGPQQEETLVEAIDEVIASTAVPATES